MATFSNTPRPAYVYEAATDQWIPVGFGPHTHAVTDVTNAFNTTTVTTKGDLVVAAGSNNITRLAAGSNGDTLVADSSTSTGLRYQTAYNGNAVINGGMDIWQRGTSFTSASVYTADRWFKGSQPNWTTTRQTSGLTGFQYAMRFQRDSGNTSTVGCQMFYNLETADALRFAGQTVTVSFYARAGANFSANSSQFSYIVYTGTGTDQRRDQSTGYTGEAQAANSSITLTTSWQRFQFTASIGSTATEIAIALGYTPTGTAGAADYADITGIQLEVGSVATTFKRSNGAGGTIQGELAACQRYYYRQNWQALSNYAVFGTGFANTTGAMYVETTFPVNMRVKPTAVDTAAMSLYAFEVGVTFISTPTTIALDSNYSSPNNGTLAITKSGSFTVGTYYRMSANNNSGAYIGWSAEL